MSRKVALKYFDHYLTSLSASHRSQLKLGDFNSHQAMDAKRDVTAELWNNWAYHLGTEATTLTNKGEPTDRLISFSTGYCYLSASKMYFQDILTRNNEQNHVLFNKEFTKQCRNCLLYTSPSPRDLSTSRMPSSA